MISLDTILLDTILRDIVYATRVIRKNPVFAVAAVLTLALGIGGSTAMFTVVRAVLLKPLEYSDPNRLVTVPGGATPIRFEELKASSHSFTGLGAFTGQESLTLTGGAEPEVLAGARVSANFLDLLGANPLLGRSFRPEEDTRGAPAVTMISSELWRRRFAGDPAIIGKTVLLEATQYTVAAVLPAHFEFPYPGVDVWMTAPEEWPLMAPKSRALSPFLSIFGRLRPGFSLEQVNAEMTVIQGQYARAHPAMLDAKPKSPDQVKPMRDQLVANVRSILWMLFGAMCFVLLIACANVASLLLARASSRSREFAVRHALGAGRNRLIGQLLTESVLLSCAGGVLGVLIAGWSLGAIHGMTAFALPRATEIQLDWKVLMFTAALSVTTGLLFGLAPAFGAARTDLIGVLRARGESASPTGFSLRGALVTGQIALSVVLLIGAGLLMQSVVRLRHVEVGFKPANLLTTRISLPPLRYDTDQKRASFFQELTRRIEALPGVRGVSTAMFLPMSGYVGSPVQDAGKPVLKLNERPLATLSIVAPQYFRTLEIPVRRGREFTERDKDGAPRVVIIDEACARHFWPAYPGGLDPIGQRLLVGGVNRGPVQIIGIAADVRQNLENKAWPIGVYLAFAQNPTASAMLAIRTAGDPLQFAGAVRGQVRALDVDQPVAAVRSMDDLAEAEVGQRRLTVGLLGSFAGVALLLAVIGIYGVVAYAASQRMQEFGIRRALGAQHGNILRLVAGQGLSLALIGVALGFAGAFALTRVMKHLLFQVSATDPITFVGVACLFVVVALAASSIPARRAARVDPMVALRVE